MMNTRLIAGLSTIGALVIVLAVVGVWQIWPHDDGNRAVVVRSISAFDFSNDRALAGFANDVFFVYILADPAPAASDAYHWPTVTYHAEVLESLKGSASGKVKVNQMGGANVTVEDQGDMLEMGKSYLLATRHDPNNGWHVVSSAYQKIPLNVPTGTDKSDVMGTPEAQVIKNRFKDAIQNQEAPAK